MDQQYIEICYNKTWYDKYANNRKYKHQNNLLPELHAYNHHSLTSHLCVTEGLGTKTGVMSMYNIIKFTLNFCNFILKLVFFLQKKKIFLKISFSEKRFRSLLSHTKIKQKL